MPAQLATASPLDARLGPLGSRLLARLDREGRAVITLPDDWPLIEDAIEDGREAGRALLQRLAASGWLRRVRRGTFVVVDRTATARIAALELVGHVSKEPYLVTAGRALAEAGLSDQAFRSIVVLSTHEQRAWTWRRERVVYALVPAERLWGGARRQVGGGIVWIARPERALLDSLARPRWGVSLAQVAEAIDHALARDPAFALSLARAARRYGRTSVARRVGFLVDRLAGGEASAAFEPLVGDDPKPTPLRPGAPDTGDVDPRWRIRANVPIELLLDHREG